nr:MAG TPA: hypothetical protein [Caudoviricetes sp.]
MRTLSEYMALPYRSRTYLACRWARSQHWAPYGVPFG